MEMFDVFTEGSVTSGGIAEKELISSSVQRAEVIRHFKFF